MRKFFLLASLFIIFAGVFSSVKAQADVGIKPNFAGGEVTSISDSRIILKTDDGEIEAILSGATVYKRVPPENFTLKAAVDSSFAEIGVGDKILVTGLVSQDKKKIPAKAVYLITKSDLAQKLANESQEWKTRSIGGKVVSVDPLSKEIVVSTRSFIGETKTIISPKENIRYKRYAPDSNNYSEANPSSLGEINPGDMIRALGDKGENNSFKAEVVLTGAFQTTIGTVSAIDAEKNEVTVLDNQTKKTVTVVVGKSSFLKQFPPEMAQRMAMMQMAGGGQGGQGGANRPPQGNNTGQPGGGQPGMGQGGQGGQGGGMRGGSIDDLLERLPTITVADLKVGDTIAVSSTKTANAERITAIKLLSGVEPFLKVPQMPAGANGGRGGRGGQDSGFSIPGLDDGFGVP